MNREFCPKVLNNFLDYMKINKNKSDKTIESYSSNLHMFIAFMKLYKEKKEVDPKAELTKTDIHITGEKFFSKITLTDLNAFVNYLDLRGNKASSKVQRIKSIKSFYNYMYKYKIISENITQDLEEPKLEKRKPIFLNIEDSKKLLKTVKNSNSRNNKRDYCIFTLFLHCGIRISELTNIKFEDIDFVENTLLVYGKGYKERIVDLNNACIKVINNYLPERKEIQEKIRNKEHHNLLFINNHYENIKSDTIEKRLKELLKEAGINNLKITPHKLRHTFATLQHDNGMDIVELQQVLGHEQITTTQIYVHANNKTIKSKMNNNPLND